MIQGLTACAFFAAKFELVYLGHELEGAVS
jgi:hypothetical protein